MKLKSSNKGIFTLLIGLIVVTVLLFLLKSQYTKPSKYPHAPEFEQKSTLNFIQLSLKEKHYKKLKKKRDKAISVGVLETQDTDYVPATVAFNGKEYRADIRLKGDWTDHLEGDKWSFRIKLKNDQTILGMRKFSIHHPKTRGHLNEWLFHKVSKAEDLIGLRYSFVEGAMHIKLENSSEYINKDLGLYAIEETFDKRTIESNKRKESVILKFSENFWWGEVKKATKVGAESGIGWNKFMNNQKNLLKKYQIAPFSEEKTLSDPTMHSYFKLSKNLLEDLRRGNTTIDKVFDVKKLALHNAILNVFGALHSTYIINLRFYYNPITSKLEPITFDGNSGLKLKKYTHFLFLDEEKDSVYLKELANAMYKVIQPGYIDKFVNTNKNDLDNFEKELKREFKVKLYNIENYRYNQGVISQELNRLSEKYNLSFSKDLGSKPIKNKLLEVDPISKWQNNSLFINKISQNSYKLSRKDINKPSFVRIKNIESEPGAMLEVSVVVKKNGENDLFGLRIQSKYPNRVDAVFNLNKGTLEGIGKTGSFQNELATIKLLKNGWFKCTIKTRAYSEKVNIIMGPTDESKGITNWEGSNKTKSSVLLDPNLTIIISN